MNIYVRKALKTPAFMIWFILAVLLILVPVAAPVIAPHDPLATNYGDSLNPGNAEYLVLRIEGNSIACFRHGGVMAKIVINGDLKMLPNGIFGLNDGDKILVATENFYSSLTDEGILADALVSDTCAEWMNLMVRRISDTNQLKCGNLSAVTLLVR